MHKLIFTMAAALTLAGCGNNPQTGEDFVQTDPAQSSANPAQIKIAEIDFLNMSQTHDIAKTLAPADAPLFLEYAINWKASKVSGDESKILMPDGTAPVTVADAIGITRAVQAGDR